MVMIMCPPLFPSFPLPSSLPPKDHLVCGPVCWALPVEQKKEEKEKEKEKEKENTRKEEFLTKIVLPTVQTFSFFFVPFSLSLAFSF